MLRTRKKNRYNAFECAPLFGGLVHLLYKDLQLLQKSFTTYTFCQKHSNGPNLGSLRWKHSMCLLGEEIEIKIGYFIKIFLSLLFFWRIL